MPDSLSYELHKLTGRLDRAADGLLQHSEGISYARFLALFAVRETAGSQRQLAHWLGLTEPSASRMVAVLAEEGLLSVAPAASGNRRQLSLSHTGAGVVDRSSRLLDERFRQLVDASGVAHDRYQRDTRRLLDQLDRSHGLAVPTPAPGS